MEAPNTEKFNSRVSAAAFGVVLGVLGIVVLYPLLSGKIDEQTANNMALTALGLAGGVAMSAKDWFMRGRVQAGGAETPTPNGGSGSTVNVASPSTVNVLDTGVPNTGPTAALPIQATSRGLRGRLVKTPDSKYGAIMPVEERAEGGESQRGAPGS